MKTYDFEISVIIYQHNTNELGYKQFNENELYHFKTKKSVSAKTLYEAQFKAFQEIEIELKNNNDYIASCVYNNNVYYNVRLII